MESGISPSFLYVIFVGNPIRNDLMKLLPSVHDEITAFRMMTILTCPFREPCSSEGHWCSKWSVALMFNPAELTCWTQKSWGFGSVDFPFQVLEIFRWTSLSFLGVYSVMFNPRCISKGDEPPPLGHWLQAMESTEVLPMMISECQIWSMTTWSTEWCRNEWLQIGTKIWRFDRKAYTTWKEALFHYKVKLIFLKNVQKQT